VRSEGVRTGGCSGYAHGGGGRLLRNGSGSSVWLVMTVAPATEWLALRQAARGARRGAKASGGEAEECNA
jgi:hypothetical protein